MMRPIVIGTNDAGKVEAYRLTDFMVSQSWNPTLSALGEGQWITATVVMPKVPIAEVLSLVQKAVEEDSP